MFSKVRFFLTLLVFAAGFQAQAVERPQAITCELKLFLKHENGPVYADLESAHIIQVMNPNMGTRSPIAWSSVPDSAKIEDPARASTDHNGGGAFYRFKNIPGVFAFRVSQSPVYDTAMEFFYLNSEQMESVDKPGVTLKNYRDLEDAIENKISMHGIDWVGSVAEYDSKFRKDGRESSLPSIFIGLPLPQEVREMFAHLPKKQRPSLSAECRAKNN